MTAMQQARQRCIAGLFGLGLICVAGLASWAADADEIIVVDFDTTEVEGGQGPLSMMSGREREDLCTEAGREDALERYTELDRQVRFQLVNADPALEQGYDDLAPSEQEFADGLEDACEKAEPTQYDLSARVVYSTCRMTMRDGYSMIDVRFPPGSGQGYLTFLDPETFQAIERSIEFTELLNQRSGVAQGAESGSVRDPGESRERNVEVNHDTVTMNGREHRFDFNFELNFTRSMWGLMAAAQRAAEGTSAEGAVDEGTMGAAQMTPEQLAQMEQFMQMFGTPTISSYGTALIAPDAPGLDIIRAFYRTFASAMGADGAYLAGLYNHELLEKGFPLELEQTTRVIMPGAMAASFAGFPGVGGGEESTSTTTVTRIIGPLTTDNDFCQGSVVPPEYAASSPASGVSSPGGTAGGGPGPAPSDGLSGGTPVAGAPSGAAPNALAAGASPAGLGAGDAGSAAQGFGEVTNAVSEAMNGMTPEQRRAVEQAMGQFGGGLSQMLGGAAAAAAAAGGTVPDASAASEAPALRAGPSSSELMTDDLTQSVQNMLQALGYDPGNTDGEPSVETTIAISQFQAEQGLEVTGEVTPQLAGILAAEVDR